MFALLFSEIPILKFVNWRLSSLAIVCDDTVPSVKVIEIGGYSSLPDDFCPGRRLLADLKSSYSLFNSFSYPI